jgi:FixJ family two-component response regulator
MEIALESQLNILVVDDELEITKRLTAVLQMNLYNAVSFTDPVAAIESAGASEPGCLISDIVMSGIDLEIAIRRAVLLANTSLLRPRRHRPADRATDDKRHCESL